MPTPWTCPHCSRVATIGNSDIDVGSVSLETRRIRDHHSEDGARVAVTQFVVCPDPLCNKYTLTLTLSQLAYHAAGGNYMASEIRRWTLVPASTAIVVPSYVPVAIRRDYEEACLIREGSPKASATLSRRCLEGMIRDFYGTSAKKRLIDAIKEIQPKVDPLTWQAIDAVRQIGNIGAHMESDINVIVDVEPEEAELLIQLIEDLISDWYIAREERRKQLNAIKAVAAAKQATRVAAGSGAAPAGSGGSGAEPIVT